MAVQSDQRTRWGADLPDLKSLALPDQNTWKLLSSNAQAVQQGEPIDRRANPVAPFDQGSVTTQAN